MKTFFLSTILLVPLLLAGCVSAGVEVGSNSPGYYHYDNAYYYGSGMGSFEGYSYDAYNSGYRPVASTVAVHSDSHLAGASVASVSSSGHKHGGRTSSVRVAASGD